MAINKRKIQEVNSGSMADIAFLLLCFFLVTTTMSVDSGIQRVLPPWVDDIAPPPVKERDLIEVKINQQDQIMAAGRLVRITEVKEIVKEFLLNRGDFPDMPEKVMTDIELIGSWPVSKGIVSLQNDRGTSYNMYVMVQNELQRALNEIRDEIAVQVFGTPYRLLDDAGQRAVRKAQPTAISEAVPRDTGGN
jgi:biopolymer transport protein ExbD